MTTPIHQFIDSELDDRNVVLQMALGILALSGRVDALLTCAGVQPPGSGVASEPEPMRATEHCAGKHKTVQGDALLMDAVLGVLGVRRSLMAKLFRAAKPKAEQPVPNDDTGRSAEVSGSATDLLR